MSLSEQFESWTRRKFMQVGAATAVSAGLAPSVYAEAAGAGRTMINVPFEKRNPAIAMIGVGGRGTTLLGNLLAADAQVVGVCDVVRDKAEHAAGLVSDWSSRPAISQNAIAHRAASAAT